MSKTLLTIALSLCSFFCQGSEGRVLVVDKQRDTLWIVNDTHRDEGGGGRSLYILWEGDVHTTHEKPKQTYSLDPSQKDSRDSTYIEYGNNVRNFKITLRRIRDGEHLELGSFWHGIYNGSLANGHAETVTIFKNYTADHVEIWGEFIDGGGQDRDPQKVRFPIGQIPRDFW